MRLILDTNVLISGLISPVSVPGKIIKAWRNEEVDFVFSEEGIAELTRVLNYPRVSKYLKWNELEIINFVSILRFKCKIVDITGVNANVPADPDDSHILAALIVSEADFLITGDKGILDLKEKYKILTPAEFEKIFL